MKSSTACVVSCGVCLALLGCAGERRQSAEFRTDQMILKPHPSIEGGLIYRNRGIDPEHLRAVPVESVEVQFAERDEEDLAKPGEVAVFRTFGTDELLTAIGKYAVIATEQGSDKRWKRKDAYVASDRPPRGH